MHQEYPRLMYASGTAATRLVHDATEQSRAEHQGFSTKPGVAHLVPHRTAGPAELAVPEPLTEAHIPLIVEHVARALGGTVDRAEDAPEALTVDHVPVIVDAVFERLKGMATAATEGEAHRDALHDGLDARFAALKDDLLGGISALIAAPTPAPVSGKKA